MLLAKRSTSRLSHDTGIGGYSKPTPGPLILLFYERIWMEGILESAVDRFTLFVNQVEARALRTTGH